MYLEFEFCFANTAHHEANTLSDVFWRLRAVFAADNRFIPQSRFDMCQRSGDVSLCILHEMQNSFHPLATIGDVA